MAHFERKQENSYLKKRETMDIHSKASDALFCNNKPDTKNDSKSTPNYIYYRIFGYCVGGGVHLSNIIAMAIALRGPIMNDPDIAMFYSMEFVYITIWNLVFQLFYIGIGLACDVPVLLNMKTSSSLNRIRCYRKTFCNGVLWPYGLTITIIFWPSFAYDRNLIFPDYIDKVLSPVSNYIIHLFILFPVLWEMFFLPNQKPTSHKYTFGLCVTILCAYLIVLFGHYVIRGIWPYPILKLLYGTIYFPLVFIVSTILLISLYYIQWSIISCIWQNKSNEKQNK